jgi:hypothetical protein
VKNMCHDVMIYCMIMIVIFHDEFTLARSSIER